MSNINLKRGVASLVFRKIQIKITRFHYAPTKMDITKSTVNSKHSHGCVETHTHTTGGNVKDETVIVTLENNWAVKKACK